MIETGTVLQDRFLIEKELARGGMGAVYLATDQKFGSRVAIKERTFEGAQLAEAFAREARILNCLHHPILPHVSDYFSEHDGHFLVMEYIEGEDLSEILKREGWAFPVADVVRWMLDLLEGLDYLHSQDPPIVHRDIKPGNLKLTSRGNIVLLDFGLAKETSGGTQGAKSVFGYSRRYSPLEQIEGAGTDPRSDIFSLGATAYHLITGEPPVDVLARASAIVAGKPDPLMLASEVNPDVGSQMAQILNRALALDASQRYSTAREMISAIEAVAASDTRVQTINVEEPAEQTPIVVPIMAPSSGDDVTFNDEAIAPERDKPTTSNSQSIRPTAGWVYRPAVWVAAVLAVLLVAAYALTRKEQNAVQVAPVAESVDSNSATNTEIAPIVGEAEPEANVSDVEPEPEPRRTPEVATASNSSTNDEERTRSDAPRRAEPQDAAIEFEEIDGELVPVVPMERRRATIDRRNRRSMNERMRRQRARRALNDEPPVSSIETIFTGVPPDRLRRRPRRYEPY